MFASSASTGRKVAQNARSMSTVTDFLFNKSSTPRVALDTVYPGVTLPKHTAKPAEAKTKVSTLSSGIRVVTQDSAIPVSSVGVLVDVGSRYEDPSIGGVTNFLERMLLKSTTNRPTIRLFGDMAKLGAELGCNTSREHLILTGQTSGDINPVMGALADLAINPAFSFDELHREAEQYKKDSEARGSQYDVIVNDAIHTAAYGTEGLGASLYAHDSTVPAFDAELLKKWHESFFTGNRMVISASGVEHESFVKLCEELFAKLPKATVEIPKVPSAYVGGNVRLSDRTYNGLTHVALGFNAPSWASQDVYAASVLQTLMGGGGSFSSGGPGKGLYSRLYQNVLYKYNWVESVVSFNSIYSDAGLFGIYGMAPASAAGSLTDVLVAEAQAMTTVTEDEVARSKNMLKASVASFLEHGPSRVEEMARFVQIFGTYDPLALAQNIDKVSVADVQRVASQIIKSPVSIATYGDATRVPSSIKL